MVSQREEQNHGFADPQEDSMLKKPQNYQNFSLSFSNTVWISFRLRNDYFQHEDH